MPPTICREVVITKSHLETHPPGRFGVQVRTVRLISLALASGLLAMSIAAAADNPRKLGWLSSKYEVGRNGPETISTGTLPGGVEDPGGKSYGSFQLASRRGPGDSSVSEFVGAYYPEDFRKPKPGSPAAFEPFRPETAEFDAAWRKVVKREGDLFLNNEHEYIYDTHYAPVADQLRKDTGLDLAKRTDALRNVAWSVAVQHGPPSDPKGHAVKLLEKALGGWSRSDLEATFEEKAKTGVSDQSLIDAVYKERDRRNEDGGHVWFGGKDLGNRFRDERNDALRGLQREEYEGQLRKTALDAVAARVGIIATPVRRPPKELFVDRGQKTFDFSGYETPYENSRGPRVPNDFSGVSIGRGYDLGRVSREQAEDDLRAAGLASPHVDLYAKAAGLRGEQARAYLDGFRSSDVYSAARKEGLKGQDLSRYVQEHTPPTITLGQQKTLFERSYARTETTLRETFPDYARYPGPAREALADMAFTVGAEQLPALYPAFSRAVLEKDWETAAKLSRRKGAGAERNQVTKALLLESAEKSSK